MKEQSKGTTGQINQNYIMNKDRVKLQFHTVKTIHIKAFLTLYRNCTVWEPLGQSSKRTLFCRFKSKHPEGGKKKKSIKQAVTVDFAVFSNLNYVHPFHVLTALEIVPLKAHLETKQVNFTDAVQDITHTRTCQTCCQSWRKNNKWNKMLKKVWNRSSIHPFSTAYPNKD